MLTFVTFSKRDYFKSGKLIFYLYPSLKCNLGQRKNEREIERERERKRKMTEREGQCTI